MKPGDVILRNCRPEWLKVARVIWSAHRDLGLPDDEAGYAAVADELSRLVELGELEVAGNPSNWRGSEVRLSSKQ
jgi:hypothetical protein